MGLVPAAHSPPPCQLPSYLCPLDISLPQARLLLQDVHPGNHGPETLGQVEGSDAFLCSDLPSLPGTQTHSSPSFTAKRITVQQARPVPLNEVLHFKQCLRPRSPLVHAQPQCRQEEATAGASGCLQDFVLHLIDQIPCYI